jgi:UDP-N-acetylglucosamine 1-carboxyvinyltransferase
VPREDGREDLRHRATRTLTIEGVDELHGATHAVVADRIETGTYAMAAAMTGGDVLLKHARAEHLQAALDTLALRLGWRSARNRMGIRVQAQRQRHPGGACRDAAVPRAFPTDLQAQFMALMTMANGTSQIRETIFENRYMHVAELARFGADIKVDGQVATVTGVPQLKGAQVMATDLRASVSLVIAGLAARGETVVNRIYHLDRGFERLEDKLSAVGAEIERVTG